MTGPPLIGSAAQIAKSGKTLAGNDCLPKASGEPSLAITATSQAALPNGTALVTKDG